MLGPRGEAPTERTVLLTAALGTVLAPLNSTMVAVALPDIVNDFGETIAASAWLVTGYLIAQASLQPLSGKLGDSIGRRPLMLWGLGSFGLVSLGAALAPSLAVLIVFRVLQAVTAGLVFPNALALVRELLPDQRRGRAYGMLGSAIGIAAAAGPPLGGVLVALGGWRAIFLANLPLIAVALWFAVRWVPHCPRCAVGRFDWVGAVGLTALLASTAWLLNPGGVPSWVPPVVAAVIAGLGTLFVRYELHRDDPVLQPRFLRVRAFAAATASVGLSNLAMYATLLAVPVLLSRQAGWSEAKIGLALTAMSLPLALLSRVGGALSDRAGKRTAAVGGLTVLAVGLVPLAMAGEDVAIPVLIGSLVLIGTGVGLASAPVQTAGVEALDARNAGIASGVFQTGRYLGGIAAASLVAALANGASAHYGRLFAVELLAAIASTACALALPGRLRARAPEEAALGA